MYNKSEIICLQRKIRENIAQRFFCVRKISSALRVRGKIADDNA